MVTVGGDWLGWFVAEQSSSRQAIDGVNSLVCTVEKLVVGACCEDTRLANVCVRFEHCEQPRPSHNQEGKQSAEDKIAAPVVGPVVDHGGVAVFEGLFALS